MTYCIYEHFGAAFELGEAQSSKKAAKYFQLAADQSIPEAQYKLRTFYCEIPTHEASLVYETASYPTGSSLVLLQYTLKRASRTFNTVIRYGMPTIIYYNIEDGGLF